MRQDSQSLKPWFASSAVRAGVLVVLFVSVFTASLFLFFRGSTLLGFGIGAGGVSSGRSLVDGDRFFPHAANIKTAGDFLSVATNQELNPVASEDFILFSWVKLRRMLQEGEEVIFLTKLEKKKRIVTGYSLGFVRNGNVVRPTMYWRDSRGKGESYLFADIPLVPKRWIFITVGVFKNTILTLHSVTVGADGTRKELFHGSHELPEAVVPANAGDFFIGSRRTGKFRGQLGSFGVFRGSDLQDRYEDIRQELEDDRFEIPRSLESREIKLFVPGTTQDLSPAHHEIRIRGIPEFTKKKARGD